MTLPYTSTCMVSFCLFGPALCLVQGAFVSVWLPPYSAFCCPQSLLICFSFPALCACVCTCSCVCWCVKRIISACMSVIESAAVEATTSSSPPAHPLPCPPLSVSYALSFSLSFLSPHFFCKPLFSPSLPIPCNKLTHRKL